MAPTRGLQQALYDEIVGRIKQADSTAPVFDNGHYDYSRFETGQQYPILVRKKGSMEASEEVLLDENAMAVGHGYFSLAGWAVSPDNRLIAYGVNTGGRLFYTIRIKEIATGRLLDDTIADVTDNLAWANDSRTLFYTKQDPSTLRDYRVLRHRLGTRPADDPVVFEEKDETFSCGVRRTKSDRYLMIASRQTLSTEVPLPRRRQARGDVQGPPGPPPPPGILGRSPRRPLLRPDQSRRPELPVGEGADCVARTGELAGGHPPPRRRAARGLLPSSATSSRWKNGAMA